MSRQAQYLDELARLAGDWRRERRGDLVPRFLAALEELYRSGWDYALGSENELPDEYLPRRYIDRRAQIIDALEGELADLSTEWRSGRGGPEREAEVVSAYHRTMEELFRIGHWPGEPASMESLLPDELMPKVYHDYWKRVLGQG